MRRRGIRLALPLVILLAARAEPQEAERKAVLARSGPSVVCVRNDECIGSGIVLDDQGTILTNAHVIVSPLPLRVEAEVMADAQIRSQIYRKVVLIGVHPSRDLAIIRVDPSESSGRLAPLPLAKEKVLTHDVVFAIGFPSTYHGMKKVCTTGEVTGVDRFVDMPGYFEFTAEVHPGNSGGPVLNANGSAVGVVTFGMKNGERIAWAIPLADFRPDQFVPLDQRPKDPAKASRLLRAAEEQLKMASNGRVISGLMAGEYFQLALLEDISDPDIYYKIGMLERGFEEYSTAAAYLMRAVQIEPWGGENREAAYHELGISLYMLKRPADATVIWNEGIAKYPDSCGRIWDDLASRAFEEARFLEAACDSQSSLHEFGPRAGRMTRIYDESRKRLDTEGLAKLGDYERSLPDRIKEASQAAAQARRDGKKYLTAACEGLVGSYTGVQQQASHFDFQSLGRGPNAPKPLEIPDDQLVPLFVRSRIAVAAEHLQAGKIDLATQILEDVIKTYPTNPETQSARDLLKIIRKGK